MSPLLMVIIGLVFAIIIAFFVVLMMPVEIYPQNNKSLGNISMLEIHNELDLNYSKANITYYAPAIPSNFTIYGQLLVYSLFDMEAGPMETNNISLFILSPSYICTNSGNSRITFNISITLISNNNKIHVTIPSCEKYYFICSIYENMTNNKILLSVSIKLNNLQKDSLLIIPIKVNSCTQYLQIHVN
ncbi:MAG: hypothetical protein RXQ76_01665 [Acidianus sp.]